MTIFYILYTDYYVAGIEIYDDGTYRCAPILKNLKEINMIIKFTGTENVKMGKYKMIEIQGTKVVDGSDWGRRIFSNSDVAKKLKDFAIGDYMNVKMKKDGNFWNVADIEEPTADEIEAAKEPYEPNKGGDTKATGTKATTKSTWNGRTGEAYDRSAAIYFALDFLKTTLTDTKLKKVSFADLLSVSDDVYEYIHNGTNPYAGDSSLEPPEID